VRNTGKIFELINDIKEISENINSYIPIYPNTDTKIRNIEFSKKYKRSTERADRKIMTDIKNSTRPQSLNKRRKLTRL
jgi:hypothetical protein